MKSFRHKFKKKQKEQFHCKTNVSPFFTFGDINSHSEITMCLCVSLRQLYFILYHWLPEGRQI